MHRDDFRFIDLKTDSVSNDIADAFPDWKPVPFHMLTPGG